jgi:hypothetical protein
MIKVYKVFNPYSGTYLQASNRDELIAHIAVQALAAYRHLSHNILYTVAQINADGSEIWGVPDEFAVTDEEIQQSMQQLIGPEIQEN